MRIISGKYRGSELSVPAVVARPTTDRTREALFSIIHTVIPESKCLDLFAGSGALGIEALSRGATSCVFADQDSRAINTINQNLKKLDLVSDVLKMDALHVNRFEDLSFDLVFADPPYVKNANDRDFIAELLEGDLINKLNDSGYFIVEAASNYDFKHPSNWEIVTQRSYGSCGITILQKS